MVTRFTGVGWFLGRLDNKIGFGRIVWGSRSSHFPGHIVTEPCARRYYKWNSNACLLLWVLPLPECTRSASDRVYVVATITLKTQRRHRTSVVFAIIIIHLFQWAWKLQFPNTVSLLVYVPVCKANQSHLNCIIKIQNPIHNIYSNGVEVPV